MKKNPGRKERRGKAKNLPYVAGAMGISAVSEIIRKDYGVILSRRERKELAKSQGVAFTAYYNN